MANRIKYTFENPNQTQQVFSWLLLNYYHQKAKAEGSIAGQMMEFTRLSRLTDRLVTSILTPIEIPELEDVPRNWFMDLPIQLDEGETREVWVAEQIGSFGSYFTALLKSQKYPDRLFYLSAPTEPRLKNLITAVMMFIDDQKTPGIKELLNIEEFTGETAPEDKRLFKISFQKGKDYGNSSK